MIERIDVYYSCDEYNCDYNCKVTGLPRSPDGKFSVAPYICPDPLTVHGRGMPLNIRIKERSDG